MNRGCVPSKALLAVSGRMRELQSEHHLKALGLQVMGALFPLQLVHVFKVNYILRKVCFVLMHYLL